MRSIAFPSWVTAGSIAENAEFICAKWKELNLPAKFKGKVEPLPEIGLCFFEQLACLAYRDNDLPASLSNLPASWHLHFPLDLPFYLTQDLKHIQLSFDICLHLMDKVDFLGVKQAVLHPILSSGVKGSASVAYVGSLRSGQNGKNGQTDEASLAIFVDLWEQHGKSRANLLLENQPGADLPDLLKLAQHTGCGLCLDMAHLFMPPTGFLGPAGLVSPVGSVSLPKNIDCLSSDYLSPEFLNLVGLVHINAPGPKFSGHASLATLTPDLHKQYQSIIRALPEQATLMLEFFNWPDIEESLPIVQDYLI